MFKSASQTDDWTDRLRRHRDSKLTIEEFCKTEGVSPSTYHKWKRKLSNQAEVVASKVPEFLPVQMIMSTPTEAVTVELPNNVTLKIPGSLPPSRIAELIAACMREATLAASSKET